MDRHTNGLLRLKAFLIDAFSADELAVLVDQWDRHVATALPSPRAIPVQDYVHALVAEVWRRRQWVGKDGLLFVLAHARSHRLREIVAITVLLERPAPRPPTGPPPPPPSALEAIHEEVIAAPTVDLLVLIRARLRARADEFWIACADLYHHLMPDLQGPGRLHLTFARRRVAVVAWPHLVHDGRILEHAAVEADQPEVFYYCPRGRATPPEFRLALRPGRCSLSGRSGSVRYTLHVATTSAQSPPIGALS
jgi:hypothetical protein